MHRELRAPRINEGRFRADLEALATIGSSGDGGVNRPALGQQHLAAPGHLRDRIDALRLSQTLGGIN